jgi:hypothetical protein
VFKVCRKVPSHVHWCVLVANKWLGWIQRRGLGLGQTLPRTLSVSCQQVPFHVLEPFVTNSNGLWETNKRVTRRRRVWLSSPLSKSVCGKDRRRVWSQASAGWLESTLKQGALPTNSSAHAFRSYHQPPLSQEIAAKIQPTSCPVPGFDQPSSLSDVSRADS